jgi:hypothetical protein
MKDILIDIKIALDEAKERFEKGEMGTGLALVISDLMDIYIKYNK